jgi:hypothetical protein
MGRIINLKGKIFVQPHMAKDWGQKEPSHSICCCSWENCLWDCEGRGGELPFGWTDGQRGMAWLMDTQGGGGLFIYYLVRKKRKAEGNST